MTHASFPAPDVHAAAVAAHTRIQAAANDRGIVGAVSAQTLYQLRDLAQMAAAVGAGAMFVDLADFSLIASDLPET